MIKIWEAQYVLPNLGNALYENNMKDCYALLTLK